MDETRPDPPRCRTCEHWADLENEWGEVKGLTPDGESWGHCELLEMPESYSDYRMDYSQDGSTFVPLGDSEPSIAYAQDGSDYRASLMCRSDFGCVLHSPADPSEMR